VIAGAKRVIESSRPLIFLEFAPWGLNVQGGHSPAAFASALFKAFDVRGWADAGAMLRETLGKGEFRDLIIQLKEGASVPTLEELSYPPSAVAALYTGSSTPGHCHCCLGNALLQFFQPLRKGQARNDGEHRRRPRRDLRQRDPFPFDAVRRQRRCLQHDLIAPWGRYAVTHAVTLRGASQPTWTRRARRGGESATSRQASPSWEPSRDRP